MDNLYYGRTAQKYLYVCQWDLRTASEKNRSIQKEAVIITVFFGISADVCDEMVIRACSE